MITIAAYTHLFFLLIFPIRACAHIICSIEKQTKDRNETGPNLSLGTRLTVLSKRLGRKRCCDTTPDRCLECNRLTILTAHC